MLKKAQPYWPLIVLLAAIKFILPIIFQHSLYELQRDEYLYYQQGLHFDIGYLENPPLISWLGMISSWFGGSVFFIKLWPCIFGGATVILTCLIATELGGKRFAQFIAGLSIISGAFVRTHYLFQPNFLDIFFWTLVIYFLIRFINAGKQKFIYWLAVSIGIGWWGKYSVLFMAAALIIGLLLSSYRTIFTRKKTWLAAGLCLLIIAPNILWQYFHHWPLTHHMQELQETQLKYINRFDFLKEQLIMLLSVAIIWIAGFIWFFRKKEYRIIGIIYISVITLLAIGSGKGYYALGIYPVLLAGGGVAWENLSSKKNWLRYSIALFIIAFTYLTLPILLPTRSPERLAAFYQKIGMKNKWEDQHEHALPQDFADMLGWKELTVKSESFFNSLPDSVKANTIIYCSNYGQCGSLKFYGKDPFFKNKVISLNGSFLLWIPDHLTLKNMIFVTEDLPDKDDKLLSHFEKMTIEDSVTNKYSRQYGDKIIFFENLDPAGFQSATDLIAQKKKQFNW